MALTDLQKRIMRRLSRNRSETSYLAGGAVLNLDWPRRSDDIDIFHDLDEEVSAAAKKDIVDLEATGLRVTTDVRAYGFFEATVSDGASATIIQWMGETKLRFFPLVRDEEWGLRLHRVDLAINKVLAAASRRKARDFADLVAISTYMCPLGPLIMAAAGKPPSYSPQKMIEHLKWHAQSIPDDEYTAVKGLPADWMPQFIRAEVTRQADIAERYVMAAPVAAVGILAVNSSGLPIEVTFELDRIRDLAKGHRRTGCDAHDGGFRHDPVGLARFRCFTVSCFGAGDERWPRFPALVHGLAQDHRRVVAATTFRRSTRIPFQSGSPCRASRYLGRSRSCRGSGG